MSKEAEIATTLGLIESWTIITWIKNTDDGGWRYFRGESVVDEEQGARRLADLEGDGPRYPDPMFTYQLMQLWSDESSEVRASG